VKREPSAVTHSRWPRHSTHVHCSWVCISEAELSNVQLKILKPELCPNEFPFCTKCIMIILLVNDENGDEGGGSVRIWGTDTNCVREDQGKLRTSVKIAGRNLALGTRPAEH
jgi:hypothetical protein